MTRHLQAEYVARKKRARARAACCRPVVRRLRRVSARESLEDREARYERRVQRPRLRQAIGVRVRATGQRRFREKTSKAAWIAPSECDGQERRLEGELVDGAHILPHVIDSVARANRSGMVPEHVVG